MIPVVILAGGIGSRMGEVGKMIPKFLLPVNGEILLLRTLRQTLDKGFNRVVVCTRLEYVEQIKGLITHLENGKEYIKIQLADESSLFNSLKDIGKIVSSGDGFVLLLGDIFYFDNPFDKLPVGNVVGDVLVGKKIIDPSELSKGGIIETDDRGAVLRVVKKPSLDIGQGVRWSGMALCGRGFFDDLSELTNKMDVSHFSLEDIFEYRNTKNHDSRVKTDIEFVNINSSSHHIYANLLALAKDEKTDPRVKGTIVMCAKEIRELILKNGNQI